VSNDYTNPNTIDAQPNRPSGRLWRNLFPRFEWRKLQRQCTQ